MDHKNQIGFIESFNRTIVLNPTRTVEELKEARKTKLKEIAEKTPSCSIIIVQ